MGAMEGFEASSTFKYNDYTQCLRFPLRAEGVKRFSIKHTYLDFKESLRSVMSVVSSISYWTNNRSKL